jgi:hypothetical protein
MNARCPRRPQLEQETSPAHGAPDVRAPDVVKHGTLHLRDASLAVSSWLPSPPGAATCGRRLQCPECHIPQCDVAAVEALQQGSGAAQGNSGKDRMDQLQVWDVPIRPRAPANHQTPSPDPGVGWDGMDGMGSRYPPLPLDGMGWDGMAAGSCAGIQEGMAAHQLWTLSCGIGPCLGWAIHGMKDHPLRYALVNNARTMLCFTWLDRFHVI